MAFSGRTILPFKVGALEIVVSDDDSVSSLVVDLRQKVGCEVAPEESGAILVDGEKKAKAVVSAECSNIRRAENSSREDDDAVLMLLVILSKR